MLGHVVAVRPLPEPQFLFAGDGNSAPEWVAVTGVAIVGRTGPGRAGPVRRPA